MSTNKNLSVVYRDWAELKPSPHNARTHSKAQIRKISESVRTFGFTNPVLINNEAMIIAGHGRVLAAKLLGISQVPTIELENLTADQVRAYVIADNRLALDSGWDNEILKIELQNLVLNTDIDVGLTGFEVAEIDLILHPDQEPADPDDELPPQGAPIVSQLGDLWLLGKHRVLCGDARENSSLATLLQNQRADIVFVDPPYNAAICRVVGNGKTHHPEFAMASGEMSEAEFTEFLTTVFTRLAAWSSDGSVHFVAMDWRRMTELLTAGRRVYTDLLNLCVWTKDKGGMGSLFRSMHELIFVFRNGEAQHRNNVQLGKFGRNRTNVWAYKGANSMSRSGEDGNVLAVHPTVKPVALVADALLDCSARGGIVLDSFLGSGTTLLAAERVGRICCGLEIEPRYVDLAIRRWQSVTGEDAVHETTGKRFNELADSEVSHV